MLLKDMFDWEFDLTTGEDIEKVLDDLSYTSTIRNFFWIYSSLLMSRKVVILCKIYKIL